MTPASFRVAVSDQSCPDAERLAEYVDRLLDEADRADVERHLLNCESCRDVLAETVQFIDQESGAAGTGGGRVLPFRRWLKPATGILAAAAVLTLAVWAIWPVSYLRSGRVDDRLPLIAAFSAAGSRPAEGRLTGFPYGTPPPVLRGVDRPSVASGVLVAAADILKRETADPKGGRPGVLGVAYLATGDYDNAVTTLEAALSRQPGDPALLNDLAVAYLARARWNRRPDDLTKALAALDQAIAGNPGQIEAYFNRALTVEELHGPDRAREAWQDYTARDPSSEWSSEAARRAAK